MESETQESNEQVHHSDTQSTSKDTDSSCSSDESEKDFSPDSDDDRSDECTISSSGSDHEFKTSSFAMQTSLNRKLPRKISHSSSNSSSCGSTSLSSSTTNSSSSDSESDEAQAKKKSTSYIQKEKQRSLTDLHLRKIKFKRKDHSEGETAYRVSEFSLAKLLNQRCTIIEHNHLISPCGVSAGGINEVR